VLKCCRKKWGGAVSKRDRLEYDRKELSIGITESSSWCIIDQGCFVSCGLEPVLLVDAVEIFLRLWIFQKIRKALVLVRISVSRAYVSGFGEVPLTLLGLA